MDDSIQTHVLAGYRPPAGTEPLWCDRRIGNAVVVSLDQRLGCRSQFEVVASMTTSWAHMSEIVVGIDDTEASWGALRWAGRTAQKAKPRVRIVHSLHRFRLPHAGGRESPSVLESRRLAGRRLLRSGREELHRFGPSLAVDTIITDEPIAPYLGSISRTADLVVIGGKRSGVIRDILFGHKATRILSDALCPVVVWRPAQGFADRTSPVVVGVDDVSSDHAVAGAFWWAEMFHVPLTALHLCSAAPQRVPIATDSPQSHGGCLEWLHGRVEAQSALHPAVDVHLHCLAASAEHELRRASAAASLVVVGSRGLTPLKGSILGSVGQSLVHSSECPVMVVR